MGFLMDAGSLTALSACSREWRDAIAGPYLSEVWRALAGKGGLLLQSLEQDPKRRYLQMAAVNLDGTWVDCGTDRVASERYRFLTAMRQTQRKGLQRSFEARSHWDQNRVKHSWWHLDAALCLCYETITDPDDQYDAVVNVSSGVLDLSDPQHPRICGTWMMMTCEEPVDRVTDGLFEFRKVDPVYNERAGMNKRLRQLAGMPAGRMLYVAEPLHTPVRNYPG
eukprot:gnl/MRDRNA2_/MRDRNA2_32877_c0_seq1.p1 gnl/MRDRNA2_/MRDRNA2_32877_c0~~gnl/MRDRNA2_/MRDRNA2_32877_c0_seq1.p1  ORF type:complete len:223 (+),score=32.03 gnl/MRDRNA2_/MRDRNA2_32877_c0_seq1:254-922(+)